MMTPLARAITMAAASGGALTLLTTNLLAAWDARRSDLITEAGTGVSSWVDYHASINAAQSTDSKRPTLTPSSIGGHPTIDFNGTSDALQFASGLSSSGSAHTLYFVLNITSLSGIKVIFDALTGRWQPYTNGTSLIVQDNGGARTLGTISTGVQVLTIVASGASSLSAYTGATLIGTSASTNTALGGACGIGANNAGAFNCPHKYAAIFVYDAAHDATARAAVRAYITQEWGV